jgi:maltose alpha-D-glucosyltransferase/alpha-amylase
VAVDMHRLAAPILVDGTVDAVFRDPAQLLSTLGAWLGSRRWSGLSGVSPIAVHVLDSAIIEAASSHLTLIAIVEATGRKQGEPFTERFYVPLLIEVGEATLPSAVPVRCSDGVLNVVEAERTLAYHATLLALFADNASVTTGAGATLQHRARRGFTDLIRKPRAVTVLGNADTTNLVVKIERTGLPALVVKTYKKITEVNPEPKMLAALADAGFRHCPTVIGEVIYRRDRALVVSLLQLHIANVGDGSAPFSEALAQHLVVPERSGTDAPQATVSDPRCWSPATDHASTLGQVIAEFHQATLRQYGGGRVTLDDAKRWRRRFLATLDACLASANTRDGTSLPRLSEHVIAFLLSDVVHNRTRLEQAASFENLVGLPKIRTHQDLHLAQLLARNGDALDFTIIDFEGDPQRTGPARNEEESPLRDLGTMMRSFAYVQYATLANSLKPLPRPDALALTAYLKRTKRAPPVRCPPDLSVLPRMVCDSTAWVKAVERALVRGYVDAVTNPFLRPGRAIDSVLGVWKMEKAVLEIRYELDHRPHNAVIPLEGLLSCLRE